ncbi:hypothetical protein M758_1G108300 [Ceratodon purpureus]|nr:hypothetical protein M758_1G108300 [Ceratodon purpureus]
MLKRRSKLKSALSIEGSFLDLCKLSVRRIEDLVSVGNLLNQRQCQDLSFKLSRIILNIGELVSQTGVPTSDPLFRPILENLYRYLENAKSLVNKCGEEEWWVAAVSQIQNDNAFREILLDVGLCYNVVCELASSINREWNLHREDLRVSRTVFLPASDGEVLLDLQDLQERLEHLANETGSVGLFSQFIPTRKPPARNRCLARYLLVKSRYTSEQSQANTLETGSAIFWQRDHEPPGTWGIQSRFIGGGAGASGVCSTTWMGIRCAKKEFHLQDAERFFLQEAGILAHLKHPFIVNFFCCGNGERKGDRFIAMELMEKSLSDLIEEQKGEYFAIPIVIDIIVQIARGMWYLHDQGVAHRDLKPQNVVVNSLTSPHLKGFFSVKLVDFGMSKTKVEITKPNTISVRGVGTTRYRAPEIYPCANLDDISRALWFKADAFSFAMTCAHLLCLQIPFGDQHMVTELNNELMRGVRPELPRDCPHELKVLLRSCWDTDPVSRPSFMDICIRLETFRLQLLRGFSTPCQGFQEKGTEFIKMMLEKHSCMQRPSFVEVNDCQGEMNDPFDMSHSLLGLRQLELETIPNMENITVTEVPILPCTLGHALEHLPKSGYESLCICDVCRGYITEEVYHCQTCKFDAHPGCVEIKDTVEVSFHDHSLHLLIQNYYHDNSDAVCGFCMEPVQESEWVYRCQLCDFDVHALCTKYPKTLTRRRVHKHHLTLEQSPLEKSLVCSCCNVDIKGYHYTCNREYCDFDLHPSCAISIFNPLCIFDNSHRLSLRCNRRCFHCSKCGELGYSWLYRCVYNCQVDVHVDCVYEMEVEESDWNEVYDKYMLEYGTKNSCDKMDIISRLLDRLLISFSSEESSSGSRPQAVPIRQMSTSMNLLMDISSTNGDVREKISAEIVERKAKRMVSKKARQRAEAEQGAKLKNLEKLLQDLLSSPNMSRTDAEILAEARIKFQNLKNRIVQKVKSSPGQSSLCQGPCNALQYRLEKPGTFLEKSVLLFSPHVHHSKVHLALLCEEPGSEHIVPNVLDYVIKDMNGELWEKIQPLLAAGLHVVTKAMNNKEMYHNSGLDLVALPSVSGARVWDLRVIHHEMHSIEARNAFEDEENVELRKSVQQSAAEWLLNYLNHNEINISRSFGLRRVRYTETEEGNCPRYTQGTPAWLCTEHLHRGIETGILESYPVRTYHNLEYDQRHESIFLAASSEATHM